MTGFRVRRPAPSDADQISAIDASGLATGHATFREEPHNWASFQRSFGGERGVARVIEDQAGVAGWAGVSPVSAREVYSGVGEVSIYIADCRQGDGVGTHLLESLIDASDRAGYWTLVAQIFPENERSLALHRRAGFATVGTRKKLGKMPYGELSGQWRDVIMLEYRSEKS